MRYRAFLVTILVLVTASITPFASTNLTESHAVYRSQDGSTTENQTETETAPEVETSSGTNILCFSSTTASIYQIGTCTIENLRNETLDVHINTSNPSAVIINYPVVQIPANGTSSIMLILNQSISEEHNTSNLPAQYTTNLQFQMTWNQSEQTSTEVRNFTFPMLSFFCINPDMSILTAETGANDSRVSGLTSCHLSNHLTYNLTLEFTPVEAYYVSGSTRVELNNSDTMYNGHVRFHLNESALRAEPYGSYFQHVELNITATQGNSSITLEPALVRFTVQHLEPNDPNENPYNGTGAGLAYLLWELEQALADGGNSSSSPDRSSEEPHNKRSFDAPSSVDVFMLVALAVVLVFFATGQKRRT